MSGRNGKRRRLDEDYRWRNHRQRQPNPAPAGVPMTEGQAAFLRSLCGRAGEPFNPGWTRWQASRRIDVLRRQLRV